MHRTLRTPWDVSTGAHAQRATDQDREATDDHEVDGGLELEWLRTWTRLKRQIYDADAMIGPPNGALVWEEYRFTYDEVRRKRLPTGNVQRENCNATQKHATTRQERVIRTQGTYRPAT